MPIVKYAVCDVCGKRMPIDLALGEGYIASNRDTFFMVNICHVYCTRECFQKNNGIQTDTTNVEE